MTILKTTFPLFVLVLLANSIVNCIHIENAEDNDQFELVTESTTKLGSISGKDICRIQSLTLCLI